jgi:GPH family glycoside/pentoside/hexuronide:cation symporter
MEPHRHLGTNRDDQRADQAALWVRVGRIRREGSGFSDFLLFFYNQVIGLPAVTTSSAIAVALACDAFVDILIREFSDNLRTRLGRRHPLMYCSANSLVSRLLVSVEPAAVAE